MNSNALVRSARSHGWIVAVLACLVSVLAHLPPVPNSDQALFAVAGRIIARGGKLYTDVWDTKLPSIDYVHALAWKIFDGHLLGITALGLATDALAVASFAVVARRLGFRWWRFAATAYAAILAWSIEPNFTESYATALALAAFAAASYGRFTLSGVLLALASTFWLPSLLLVVPPALSAPDQRTRRHLLLGLVGTLALAASIFIATFGAACLRELVMAWQAYRDEPFRFDASRPSPDPLDALRSTLLQTWLAPMMVAALAKGRRPDRFALVWFVCALVGAVAAPALYPHYFSAAVPAALLLGLPGDSAVGRTRKLPSLRIAVAAVSVLLGAASIDADRRHIAFRNRVAASATALGRFYARSLAANERIYVDGYEPTIALIVDRPLPDRFALVATTQPYARARLSLIIDEKRTTYLMHAARAAGLNTTLRVLVVNGDPRTR